ncbi:MAG: hypothetical protein A3G24_25170 [Betaproteobacteria bacterium RIFCSPLOWO2_12_FULL_62_13]|nr:MAG: hypothetical protein A3G24_25170 [Betaproteobacteria bacterium RIFCSPLOWO2_12_FULL_62_13]
MLTWLTGSKPDHPMANMKKARQMVAELLGQDSLRVLEEITSWLDSIIRTEGFKLDHRLALIDLLDRGAKSFQSKLAQEYVDAPRLQKSYEGRLWNASFGFWKMLGAAYLCCIEQFQAGASGSRAVKKDLPLAVGRALRVLTVQLKWILLRYGLIEDRIWRDLARAYAFAEGQGFATTRATIYSGQHGESSAQEEFLKALMLVMSSPDSLAPAKLHIAERTVAHFGSRFTLQGKAAPGCGFFFDLSMHQPPARARKGAAAGPMVRFFGAGDAAQALRNLIAEIGKKGTLPNDVNLGGKFDVDTILSALAHLDQYWADKPPARSAQRRDLATRITVVPGFPEILRWTQAVTDASSLEFSDPAAAESWIVFNVSDGGYGAILPRVTGDWLKIGSLVALRLETSTVCRVGIVRRVTRDRYEQRRVGIQVLGAIALPVKLSPAGTAASGGAAGQDSLAVLLSHKPDKNREIAVLMRLGSFTQKRNLEMRVRDKAYLVAPSGLIEGGEDFDWARFKVVKQLY